MHQKIWAFVLGLLSVASVLLLFFSGPENARPAEQPSPSPPPATPRSTRWATASSACSPQQNGAPR